MRKLLLLFTFISLACVGFGQTTTIDFETADDGYTASTNDGVGDTDVFNRSNPDIGGNSSYIWAAEDLAVTDPSITLDAIDIMGSASFDFSIDYLTPNSEDWDTTDELLITYTVDGGASQNLMWVQSNEDGDAFNAPAAIDADFDGTGDDGSELPAITDDFGAGVGSNFETFYNNGVSVSGSSLVITLQFVGLTSAAEGIYIDNITISTDAGTPNPEPTNHVSSFTASANGHDQIDLSWSDNDGAQAADGFVIKANTSGTFSDPSDATDPTEDTDLSDGSALVKVNHGVQSHSFTGLSETTAYYFKIWPYTNEGTDIDFKTNGTVPTANATTGAAPVTPDLIISEVTDPEDDYQARFIELYNSGSTTIDFDTDTWFLSRETNGGNSWEDNQLTGSILPGETYVLANSNDDANDFFYQSFGFMADFDFGGNLGNGDDGYFLYMDGDHTSGTLVDAYGVIGVDGSGELWEYEDSKAVRKNSVTSPSDTWTATEWNIISNCNTTSMTPAMYPITTWNGGSAKSNDWSTEGNWDNGLPGNGISVFIPSGLTTYPTISSSATIKDVILEEGATLVGQENLTVNGNIYVKRSYTAYSSTSASDGWYVVSSPVNGMAITGSDFEPGANDDLYEYDENNNMWLNYTGGTFGDNSFVAGKGYLISSETTEMKSFEGSDFNADGISATLGETNTKWNLVGNPYPSKLTYANINVSSVSSPKSLNESTGAWEDISAEVDVAEGIFVYAEGSSSLTFNLDDQTHGSAKKVTQNYAYLRANFDDGLSVFARFGTDASASKNFEWKYDARYLYPATSIPYLSAITDDNVMASTNVFNEEESIIVPLYFSVNTEREISFSTEGNIGYQMAIEDNIDGSITEIDADNPFVFTALPADATNRFNLHLTKTSTIGLDEHEELAGVHVYANKRNIYFNTDEKLTNATLTVYNTIGQVLLTTEVETGIEIIRMENRGAYIVKVQSNEGRMTEKIIIK